MDRPRSVRELLATPQRSRAPWIALVASVVVLAVAAVVIVLALRPSPTVVAAPGPVSYAPSSSGGGYSGGSPYGYSGSTRTSTPTSTYPTDSPYASSTSTDATSQLEAIASSDSASVESVVDQWVPQLSSKSADPSVDSLALSDHEALRSRFPTALLVRSDDWPVFKVDGYWVTIVGQAFPSAAAANSWCDAQGIGATDCFAKRLSHSGGADGATVHR